MNSSPLNALRAVIYPAGSLVDAERAQPVEMQQTDNATRQVGHRWNPPLFQQAQQLALPLPVIRYYESVVPGSVLALRVPPVDITALRTRIETLVNTTEITLPVCQEVCAALGKALVDVAENLEGHEAFYQQTLQDLKTNTEQNPNHADRSATDEECKKIEVGHRALTQLAGE